MDWSSVRKTLSREEIQAVESELKITLPDDYKDMIGKINGGALKGAVVQHYQIGNVSYSRNVPLNKDAKANIFELVHLFNNGTLKYFPFASVGNGDYYCFDLDNYQVVLYLHEYNSYLYVCENFRQLLQMIKVTK